MKICERPPCENCVTLGVCLPLYEPDAYFSIEALIKRCTILSNYLGFREDSWVIFTHPDRTFITVNYLHIIKTGAMLEYDNIYDDHSQEAIKLVKDMLNDHNSM